jgi:hypothetical protein
MRRTMKKWISTMTWECRGISTAFVETWNEAAIVTTQITKTTKVIGTLKVHKGILCKTSTFFTNTTKDKWCDCKEDPFTITIPDVDFEVVNQYVLWLYNGACAVPKEWDKASWFLAQSYVFAEGIIDDVYKNTVMQCLIYKINIDGLLPGYRVVNHVFAGTPEGSPARRLMIDLWTYAGQTKDHVLAQNKVVSCMATVCRICVV